jgi:hypothetical protein
VKRAFFVAFWAFVGAVLGFLVGMIVEGLLHRAYPDMDEAEYMMAGPLVLLVAVVGALVGGVVGARMERGWQLHAAARAHAAPRTLPRHPDMPQIGRADRRRSAAHP